MKITAIKTPIFKQNQDLIAFLKQHLLVLKERSVLVVTSKIISYAQGRLVEKDESNPEQKHDLAKAEADFYLPSSYSQYDMILAVKDRHLTVNGGVDESNANGKYVLWPKNLQQETNKIWKFIRQEFSLKEVGVVVTDSRTWPLRWGVVGTCLSHCGFKQLTDFRGKKDLFGREIQFVKVNVAEAIASASALEMGEVAEQTPLGVVEDIKQIQFQDHVPTKKELDDLKISVQDDVYGPFLNSVEWVKNEETVKD